MQKLGSKGRGFVVSGVASRSSAPAAQILELTVVSVLDQHVFALLLVSLARLLIRKQLLEQPRDPVVCEVIGSLLFLSRCTRFNLPYAFAWLTRFVTRCCEWAPKKIEQILGFVAFSAGVVSRHEKR